MDEITKKIKIYLGRNRMTYQDLAKILNVSRQNVAMKMINLREWQLWEIEVMKEKGIL